MKNTLIIMVCATLAISCTKNKTNNSGTTSTGAVTCRCTFIYTPVRDTTEDIIVQPQPNVAHDTLCGWEVYVLKTNYGYTSGATCIQL